MHNPIILTGDRPTGRLHIGHYVGSLRQRVEAQSHYRQFVMIADLQALTDNGHNPAKVTDHVLEVMADYLAAGLDPARTTFCLQERPARPRRAHLLLPEPGQRRPAGAQSHGEGGDPAERVRAQPARRLPGLPGQPGRRHHGISRHPCARGEDQLPMLEQTNEIVRRFQRPGGQEVLTECQPILSDTGRLPGIDGKAKMSKSLGNTIELGMSGTRSNRRCSPCTRTPSTSR